MTTSIQEKNSGLPQVFSTEQVNFILQQTPPEVIKVRPGRGGKNLKYVTHSYVTQLLNKVFGFNWDYEVLWEKVEGNEVIVKGRLTVRGPNGQMIQKTQFGGSDIKKNKDGASISLADDFKAAGSDALKKCASLLGVGLDLYDEDGLPQDHSPAPTTIDAQLEDAVSSKPLAAARTAKAPVDGDVADTIKVAYETGKEYITDAQFKKVVNGVFGVAESSLLSKPQATELYEMVKSYIKYRQDSAGEKFTMPFTPVGREIKEGKHKSQIDTVHSILLKAQDDPEYKGEEWWISDRIGRMTIVDRLLMHEASAIIGMALKK